MSFTTQDSIVRNMTEILTASEDKSGLLEAVHDASIHHISDFLLLKIGTHKQVPALLNLFNYRGCLGSFFVLNQDFYWHLKSIC